MRRRFGRVLCGPWQPSLTDPSGSSAARPAPPAHELTVHARTAAAVAHAQPPLLQQYTVHTVHSCTLSSRCTSESRRQGLYSRVPLLQNGTCCTVHTGTAAGLHNSHCTHASLTLCWVRKPGLGCPALLPAPPDLWRIWQPNGFRGSAGEVAQVDALRWGMGLWVFNEMLQLG